MVSETPDIGDASFTVCHQLPSNWRYLRWPQTPPTLLRWFCQVWRRIWWVYARKYPLKILYSLSDSSPSPPERINDRARAFASHPSASYASHSGGAQRYQEDYESVTPEYTPSPGNYIDVQAHYDVPQRIRQAFSFLPSSFVIIITDVILDHPHQYSEENHIGNRNRTTNNFGSNYDTHHRPGDRTQQKPQPVRLRPVSELRRCIFRCLRS